MSRLRSIVASIIEFTKGRTSKVVFYKRNKRLSCYIFELQYDNSIDVEIKQSLEDIKKYDPKAIVVDSVDFINPYSDNFLWIDEIVDTILFLYSKGEANISEFLEKYAEEKQQQKVDRSSLKEVVKHCWDRLWKKRYSNAVFWKKNECWDYHMFFLSENNVIPREDELLLRGIQKEDNNAIVIDGYSYRYLDGDGVAGYIANEIEKYHQDKCNGHNIGAFLDNYSWEAVQKKEKQEQPPTTLKFNKEKFRYSELGFMLNACIIDFWYSRKKVLSCDEKYSFYYMKCHDAYWMAVKALLMTLRQCYKVKYNIKITDSECSIVSQDGSDYLFKFDIEQEGAYLIEKKV